MTTYSVPNIFVAGTKASAEEVNANFSYITTILDSMSAAKYPFCVNFANRNSKEEEDLFSYSSATVTSKIGDSFSSATFTTGSGIPTTINTGSSTTLTSTAYNSIVPAMTSTVQGSVTCSTTSEASGNESWHAFDKNEETYWGSFVGVTSASLAISFETRQLVRAYYIKILAPAEWILEGSNDESNWTVLDSYSAAEASTILRTIEVPGNYNIYRITANVLSGFQVQVAELDFYIRDAAGLLKLPETQIIYLGSSGIEGRANKFFRQVAPPAIKTLYDAVIPTMTSNLVPAGYEISASSYDAFTAPYLATDKKENTYWQATDTLNDVWFQVQIPNAVAAKVCKLTIPQTSDSFNKAIMNGILEGSNNGSTWTTLYTLNDLIWNYSGETKYLYFTENVTKYSYYRLSGPAPFAALAEFQLYIEAANGEYLLGEAEAGDVWFRSAEPYGAYSLESTLTWTGFDLVPAGEADLNSNGSITDIRTYAYNQNGFNINADTPKESAGNIVTYDSYVTHFGDSGYMILPNNSVIQWGFADSGESVIFPAVFPHKVFTVIVSAEDETGLIVANVNSVTNAGFTVVNSKSNAEANGIKNYWFAIGW